MGVAWPKGLPGKNISTEANSPAAPLPPMIRTRPSASTAEAAPLRTCAIVPAGAQVFEGTPAGGVV